jgi:hypothetical protein
MYTLFEFFKFKIEHSALKYILHYIKFCLFLLRQTLNLISSIRNITYTYKQNNYWTVRTAGTNSSVWLNKRVLIGGRDLEKANVYLKLKCNKWTYHIYICHKQFSLLPISTFVSCCWDRGWERIPCYRLRRYWRTVVDFDGDCNHCRNI